MTRHRVTPLLSYDEIHTPNGPRQVSSGGPPQSGRYIRTNRSANVYQILAPNEQFWKTRGVFFTTGNNYPIADTIRQSEIPVRPTMRMATGSYRQWSGNERTRFQGYHTYLAESRAEALQQGTRKGGIQPGRQNRLTVQRYRGQTYSQTTTVLGG